MHNHLSLFFACLLLLPSREAHMKWFVHVVSQDAAKSRVENERAFARDLHLGCFFYLIPKRRGSNIV